MSWFFWIFLCVSILEIGENTYALHSATHSLYKEQLLLKNYTHALINIDLLLQEKKEDDSLLEAKLITLAHMGREAEVFQHLQEFSEAQLRQPFLEEICWAVLERAATSTIPQIRFEALMSSIRSQDARAVSLIQQGCSDSSATIRTLAFHGAAVFRDVCFHKHARYAIQHDPCIQVRLAAISVFRSSHEKNIQEYLFTLLSDESRSQEEKLAVIEVLCEVIRPCDEHLIALLLQSSVPSMRILGWRLVGKQKNMLLDKACITQDEKHEEVLLEKIGVLAKQVSIDPHIFEPLLQSSNFRVQSMAAWFFLLRGDVSYRHKALAILERLLQKDESEAIIAAAILSHAGIIGADLAKKYSVVHASYFVRLTLAFGLIRQRIDVEQAVSVIRKLLPLVENIEQQNFLYFGYLAPTRGESVFISMYPDIRDPLARLWALAQIASCEGSVNVQELVLFLKNRDWSVAFQAGAFLLEEWPLQAREQLQELITHKDKKICVHAAILLALIYQDVGAEYALHEYYEIASFETKKMILMAVGSLHSEKTPTFLLRAFRESSQILRIHAASALQSCMNH